MVAATTNPCAETGIGGDELSEVLAAGRDDHREFLNALTNLTRVTKVSESPAMVPVTCQQPGAGHIRPLGVKPESPYPPGPGPGSPRWGRPVCAR